MKTTQLYQFAVAKGYNMAAVAHAESEQHALALCTAAGIYNAEIHRPEGLPLLPSRAKKPCVKPWNFNG